MPFAAHLSEHPVTAMAVGEVTGEVLTELGSAVDLAVLFVTPHHAGALEDAAAVVREILAPTVLLGCAAQSVVGGAREVEAGPGVTLWGGNVGPLLPVRLEAVRDVDGMDFLGWPEPPFEPSALLMLGDPFSFPPGLFFEQLATWAPGLPVIGGMASGAQGPGGTRLLMGDEIVTHGAVGCLIGPGVEVTTIVSQGCRPIGRPYVVTASEGDLVRELAGQSPLNRLNQMAEADLSPDDIRLANQGLHLGLVIDERREEFGPGDFLVRNVMGGDPGTGAIRVGDVVDVGSTVQFHVRDAETAADELRSLVAGYDADGVLLFTCNGRGERFFKMPDHDASVVADALDHPATAGFFAAGEFGPVGGRNFIHGYTASLALFRDRA